MPSSKPTSKSPKGLTQREFIHQLSRKANLSKRSARKTLEAFEEIITTELQAGRKVAIASFGTFYQIERSSRKGIDPNTKKPLDVPAMKLAKFRPGVKLKAALRSEPNNKK